MNKVQFQFEKKQVPQVAILGVLSLGMLGYFAAKMVTPPKPERASASVKKVAETVAHNVLLTTASLVVDSLTNGSAPSLSMRDPFISQQAAPTPTAPLAHPALTQSDQQLGAMQPTPYTNSIKPLGALAPIGAPAPTGPVAPTWSVTGVLTGETTNERIAILRNGDARRFVTLGNMVDDQYRLIGVDRFGVTLANGKQHVRLLLGGDPVKPPTASTAPSGELSLSNSSAQLPVVTKDTAVNAAAAAALSNELNGAIKPSETLN